ncbi:MAG TPA: hypothetical protein PLE48_07625, partial [Thiobacillus sp.]|nr:hypothetical protein [Thiobacillus sp.]
KSGVGASSPWVRIPPSPPTIINLLKSNSKIQQAIIRVVQSSGPNLEFGHAAYTFISVHPWWNLLFPHSHPCTTASGPFRINGAPLLTLYPRQENSPNEKPDFVDTGRENPTSG